MTWTQSCPQQSGCKSVVLTRLVKNLEALHDLNVAQLGESNDPTPLQDKVHFLRAISYRLHLDKRVCRPMKTNSADLSKVCGSEASLLSRHTSICLSTVLVGRGVGGVDIRLGDFLGKARLCLMPTLSLALVIDIGVHLAFSGVA